MSKQITNYIYLLPNEIIQIIYRYVFDNCLRELKEKYHIWQWKFGEKYNCCDTKIFLPFNYGCQHSSYPCKFKNTCKSCYRPMCNICWNRSISDARSHRNVIYVGWCNTCVWSDISN